MSTITRNPAARLPGVLDGELMRAAARDSLGAWLWPGFDSMRAAYASAVALRMVPRSMLAWRDVEVLVDALERVVLGPLARRR